MTHIEYDLIRQEYPQFRLPHYHMLDEPTMLALERVPKEVLIARRTATLLSATQAQRASQQGMFEAALEMLWK